MKKFLLFNLLFVLPVYNYAQFSESESIIGEWILEKVEFYEVQSNNYILKNQFNNPEELDSIIECYPQTIKYLHIHADESHLDFKDLTNSEDNAEYNILKVGNGYKLSITVSKEDAPDYNVLYDIENEKNVLKITHEEFCSNNNTQGAVTSILRMKKTN